MQISVGPGNTMSVMGRTFDLVQFHFHRPSEERINGRGFDMVAHLVYKDLDGRLAVVAVLIERGESHSLVQTLWNNLPLEKNHTTRPQCQSTPPKPARKRPSTTPTWGRSPRRRVRRMCCGW